MSISHFFEHELGVGLKNIRWSWGSHNAISNQVFLRVWKDQINKFDGNSWVEIYWKAYSKNSPGRSERSNHLELLKSGSRGFGVVCQAKDIKASKRTIKSFNQNSVLELGSFKEKDGRVYAQILSEIPVSKIRRDGNAQRQLCADLKQISIDPPPENTEREALTLSRVGQGKFRDLVLQSWQNQCAVTGSALREAIRASHIKPWRNSSNIERMDPNNGLPLVASLDALFDAGLVTFLDDGKVMISSEMPDSEIELFDLSGASLRTKPSESMCDYLRYHREQVFGQELAGGTAHG
jgi:putative restriction endonuclease